MERLRSHSMGLVFATFLGSCHAGWAVLVWTGAAQWLMDVVFRLHMIAPVYRITAFSFASAAGLVLLTGVIGYLFGWFLAFAWNRCLVPQERTALRYKEAKVA